MQQWPGLVVPRVVFAAMVLELHKVFKVPSVVTGGNTMRLTRSALWSLNFDYLIFAGSMHGTTAFANLHVDNEHSEAMTFTSVMDGKLHCHTRMKSIWLVWSPLE